MSSEILLLVGTLGGAFIGAFFSMISVAITKHYENKNNLRTILIEAAITDWKQAYETAQKFGRTVFPLDAYLVSHSITLDAILNKKISQENLKKMLDENSALWEVWLENSKQTQQNLKNILNNNL